MLKRIVIGFTLLWAIVFLPIETYITWSAAGTLLLSGYAVNVLGVCITIWALDALRRGRPYAEGLLATGWAWTTAVFWRATNLRYWLASEGEQDFFFGRDTELYYAPVATTLAGLALVGALLLLIRRETRPSG